MLRPYVSDCLSRQHLMSKKNYSNLMKPIKLQTVH